MLYRKPAGYWFRFQKTRAIRVRYIEEFVQASMIHYIIALTVSSSCSCLQIDNPMKDDAKFAHAFHNSKGLLVLMMGWPTTNAKNTAFKFSTNPAFTAAAKWCRVLVTNSFYVTPGSATMLLCDVAAIQRLACWIIIRQFFNNNGCTENSCMESDFVVKLIRRECSKFTSACAIVRSVQQKKLSAISAHDYVHNWQIEKPLFS